MLQPSPPTTSGITALAAFAVLALHSCGAVDEPVFCTEEFRYGIQLTAVDAGTDRSLMIGAGGEVVDGAHREALQVMPSPATEHSVMVGAGERAGRYRVTVSHPGYREWSQENVLVTADACHVNPVILEARLERVP